MPVRPDIQDASLLSAGQNNGEDRLYRARYQDTGHSASARSNASCHNLSARVSLVSWLDSGFGSFGFFLVLLSLDYLSLTPYSSLTLFIAYSSR